MYLLLAFLKICAAAARLAKIRTRDRSALPVNTAAGTFGHPFFHISHSSLPRWVMPSGDAGLAPSRLLIASAASEST